MDGHCLVMCGEWRCSADESWEFIIDKQRLSRIIPLKEGIRLSELGNLVMSEFGINGDELDFRYWQTNSLATTTGVRTPPVVLTSDRAISYFLRRM